MERWVTVARVGDIPPGETIVVEVGWEEILLAHVEGEGYYAIENICTHDGGPLGEGRLDGAAVECPRHGARFDVRSGEVLALPAILPVNSYPLRVEGDEIRLATRG